MSEALGRRPSAAPAPGEKPHVAAPFKEKLNMLVKLFKRVFFFQMNALVGFVLRRGFLFIHG